MRHPVLSAAIEAAGGAVPFRAAVGISPRTLSAWRKGGVPDVRWHEVAAASRGAVSVQDLALERAAYAERAHPSLARVA